MYADNTSLAYVSNSIDDITKSLNAELEKLRKWLHGNKPTLNAAKTTFMIIGTNKKLHQSNSEELIQALGFLGVILDNQMKWKDHISLISQKVSRAVGIIKYAKQCYHSICWKCYI